VVAAVGERIPQVLRTAAATARTPSADPAVRAMLLGDLAPWLVDEDAAVHGTKAPRPY
jgi:hypothetical protein